MASRRTQILLAFAASSLAAPSAIAGQVPGYQQLDTRAIMAEYRAEVIEHVNRVMGRWGSAWGRDDVDGVADLYWENAVLIPPGGVPLRGQAAIREHLTRTLPAASRMEAFMLDFDASGGMAVVSGGGHRSGPLMTVYLQRGRTWKIRSQVFAGP